MCLVMRQLIIAAAVGALGFGLLWVVEYRNDEPLPRVEPQAIAAAELRAPQKMVGAPLGWRHASRSRRARDRSHVQSLSRRDPQLCLAVVGRCRSSKPCLQLVAEKRRECKRRPSQRPRLIPLDK